MVSLLLQIALICETLIQYLHFVKNFNSVCIIIEKTNKFKLE